MRASIPGAGALPRAGAFDCSSTCIRHLWAPVTNRTLLALIAAGAALTALAVASARAGDLVLYNHSPSLPVGFYVRVPDAVAPGSIVTIRARDAAPVQAAARGFDGDADRFLKRVAAAAGDIVCANDVAVTINGARRVIRAAHDTTGRPLRFWSGCTRLEPGELFLLGDTEDSFDGRYWGPVRQTQIEGVWRKL